MLDYFLMFILRKKYRNGYDKDELISFIPYREGIKEEEFFIFKITLLQKEYLENLMISNKVFFDSKKLIGTTAENWTKKERSNEVKDITNLVEWQDFIILGEAKETNLESFL